MPLLLFVIFILVPIAELYVIVQVGQAIGVLQTLALLILDSILGTWLLRHQGRAAWLRFRVALAEGRVPARETADGALVILGGALLLTPGFITDVFGLALLIPPSRALFRGLLTRNMASRIIIGVSDRTGRRPRTGGPGGPGTPGDDVVEGTAVDVDPPHLAP